jgi:hypothetical protein
MASFIKTPDHLTVVFEDGEVATIYPSNPNYDKIITALNSKSWETVRELADPAVEVKRAIASPAIAERVHIQGGVVYFDNEPLHTHLTDRMLEMVAEGIDVNPLGMFLQNMMENPSYRAIKELYGFLEASNLPITEDGHFLAYKRINLNWKDAYSNTIDNSIGAVVEMSRNAVDEDKDRTCSTGLHFCSREYLPHYGAPEGGRVVIVKINPRDVVAIPSDYNNAKGRTCRYEVINEIVLESESYAAMPAATLEDTFRRSGTHQPVSNNDVPSRDYMDSRAWNKGTERVLIQVNPADDNPIARFSSPAEASKMTGIDASGISKAARGVRNLAGGYNWRYEYIVSDVQSINSILEADMHELDDEDDEIDFWGAIPDED